MSMHANECAQWVRPCSRQNPAVKMFARVFNLIVCLCNSRLHFAAHSVAIVRMSSSNSNAVLIMKISADHRNLVFHVYHNRNWSEQSNLHLKWQQHTANMAENATDNNKNKKSQSSTKDSHYASRHRPVFIRVYPSINQNVRSHTRFCFYFVSVFWLALEHLSQ